MSRHPCHYLAPRLVAYGGVIRLTVHWAKLLTRLPASMESSSYCRCLESSVAGWANVHVALPSSKPHPWERSTEVKVIWQVLLRLGSPGTSSERLRKVLLRLCAGAFTEGRRSQTRPPQKSGKPICILVSVFFFFFGKHVLLLLSVLSRGNCIGKNAHTSAATPTPLQSRLIDSTL